MRTDQGTNTDSAMLGFDLLQPVSNVLKRSLPIHNFPLSTLLEHGTGETLGAVQCFVRKPITVRDPAFVDRFVFKRHHAHDFIVLDLDHQVRTGRVVRADRFAARQLPGTGAVTKRLAGQRAYRADIDHVARELGINRFAQDGGDLRMLTAVDHA